MTDRSQTLPLLPSIANRLVREVFVLGIVAAVSFYGPPLVEHTPPTCAAYLVRSATINEPDPTARGMVVGLARSGAVAARLGGRSAAECAALYWASYADPSYLMPAPE